LGGGDYTLFCDCKNLVYGGVNNFFLIILYDFFLGLKIVLINFIFVFIRANLPRFRFDQLMFIGWKVFLPLSLAAAFFYPCTLFVLGSLKITQLPRIGSNFNFIKCFSIRF
jgi:NADH:ubiquinone oxidoreductase subunit H